MSHRLTFQANIQRITWSPPRPTPTGRITDPDFQPEWQQRRQVELHIDIPDDVDMTAFWPGDAVIEINYPMEGETVEGLRLITYESGEIDAKLLT